MRLHRVEIEGFGPFRDRQTVDFDAYADDGIFLITGRTGAGKSSVLDAVCFALYGGVPRYEGSDKRLRSDHCGPDDLTRVVVEFTAAGERWRVSRSPDYDRPKKRGDGWTRIGAEAQLDLWSGEHWEGRAAGPRNVGVELDQVVGLSQQQFLQVILLAQNQFQRFLLAKNDERQSLLRTLFGTRTYVEYERTLDERRKAADAGLATGRQRVAVRLDEAEHLAGENDLLGDAVAEEPTARDADERIAALQTVLARAEYRLDTLDRERAEAETAAVRARDEHAEATRLRGRQGDRDTSRGALALLAAAAPTIDTDRRRLARAHAAEALRAPLESADRAARATRSAATIAADARTAWGADDEAAALSERIEKLTRELGVWSDAAEQESALGGLDAESAAAMAVVAATEKRLAEVHAIGETAPGRLAQLEADLGVQASLAARLDDAVARSAELAERLIAARSAETLAAELRGAEQRALETGTAMQRASSAVTALLERRLRGHAGELAAALIDGEPCAVCGALEHPHPAVSDGEPVTDDLIARAEVARDVAVDADRVAAMALREARDAHATSAARAGGDTAEVLAVAASESEAAVGDSRAAEAAVRELTAQRDRLRTEQKQLADERDLRTAALGTERERSATLFEKTVNIRRIVDAARGAFASVADRIADATDVRARAILLAGADAEFAQRQREEREVVADRDARLIDSEFVDAADAAAALESETTRASLDQRVRAHDESMILERARLLDLELEMLPDEPVDVVASQTAADAAIAAAKIAVESAVATAVIVARLRDLASRAGDAHRQIRTLAAEHDVIARLANTVAGRAPNTLRMTLEAFVLAAELEEIVAAANLRLAEMSSGRYRLQHSDALAARGAASGLGLEVMDAYTGQTRPPQSLSGGETFLASLALALGLAEVVTGRAGGMRLDTLFIDEGFGSLDADTRDIAMRVLDDLRQGGRTVGVISHVEAMKDEIPAQLAIEMTPQGPSVIRQDLIVRA